MAKTNEIISRQTEIQDIHHRLSDLEAEQEWLGDHLGKREPLPLDVVKFEQSASDWKKEAENSLILAEREMKIGEVNYSDVDEYIEKAKSELEAAEFRHGWGLSKLSDVLSSRLDVVVKQQDRWMAGEKSLSDGIAGAFLLHGWAGDKSLDASERAMDFLTDVSKALGEKRFNAAARLLEGATHYVNLANSEWTRSMKRIAGN